MSIKFSSFAAMTRQNQINALMNIKKTGSTSQTDFLLVLHAMLSEDLQVAMAAKMAIANFTSQSWYQDFGKPSDPETTARISEYLRNSIGYGPELIEITDPPERQQMAQNLARKQKKFETTREWEGPFAEKVQLLNTLREDSWKLIEKNLKPGESIEKCWLCLFSETLQPFKDCIRSLDGNASTMVVNLSRIQHPDQIDPALGAMFKLLGRPAYLLALVTGKRAILFLRDEIGTSQAAILVFNLQNICSVNVVKEGMLSSVEIETHQDFIKLPLMANEDAEDAVSFLKERSVESIEATEDLIDRDFEKELKKLEMLFKARAIKSSEYFFRKSRLQKMELEKFSDANIELLLARRFADGIGNDKFDEQLLKKFTFEKTIMFTDIVGFSTQASQKMLLDTMTLLAVHDKLLMPTIKQFEGTLIKKIGDALMVRFDDPLQACMAAQDMQNRLFDFNARSEEKIFIRIGINTGTVFIKNEDVFGDAVNMAARMEALAKPGRIFVTETTMQKLENRLPAENLGPMQVKGRSEPINVYSIIDKTSKADEMAAMANEFLQNNGADSAPEKVASPERTQSQSQPEAVPAQESEPATEVISEPNSETTHENTAVCEEPPINYPGDFLNAIDYARYCYIRSVKDGRARQSDLEDWFARFELYLRPRIQDEP